MHQNKSCQRAVAMIHGDTAHPGLRGTVCFEQKRCGVLVTVELFGLPQEDAPNIFGFHIHEEGICSPETADGAFEKAGAHYNPMTKPHPSHAGDLPPLFGCSGYAYSAVFTDRFTVAQIVGRSVIVHDRPDDFTSQPGGDAGARIGCGKICLA